MRVYHQCGHNFVWNLDSLVEDGAGDGLIISPVNIRAEKIPERFSGAVLGRSFIDPQFFLPDDPKSKLQTYPFFPGIVMETFSTSDFDGHAADVAEACIAFQRDHGFRYSVIPTRYFEDLPEGYLGQLTDLFVDPFIEADRRMGEGAPLLLTVIAKQVHLDDGIQRTELISWATNFPQVAGIYLIFDNNYYTKQIKDPTYLSRQLKFVHDLVETGVEVHVGYTNVEGLLLSAAGPTSVSMGAYENLRSFGIQRLETREPQPRRGPRPRVYSPTLLQWIEDTYLGPFRELVDDYENLFGESPYRDFLLDERSSLNSNTGEVYKHYFWEFARQARGLPEELDLRAAKLREWVEHALAEFDRVRSSVYLDQDSDQSHLPAWMNALTMFERYKEE